MKVSPASNARMAVICAIGLTLCVGLVAAQPPQESDLKQFWSTFRSAVLQKDWSTLEDLTNFPVLVRGELDRDPVHQVRRSEFRTVFERFLKEGVFSPGEQLKLIRSTTTIEAESNSGELCRVGDMVFRKTAKGWRLSRLYMQYSLD